MFSENIGNDYIVIQEGTSEGTQVKYKKDGYWYKKDNRGNEGRAEYLVSKFMQFTTLQENEFISYEEGTINGKSGCRSKNFLDEEEELVTFYRLYYNEVGKDLSKVIANMNTMEERIEYVIRFIDAGNIWTIRSYANQPGGVFKFDRFYKQIAVAYGLGLRLDLDFFILRFDGGMKAVNPAYETRKEHFPIIHPKFSRDFAFHFAVGYPF